MSHIVPWIIVAVVVVFVVRRRMAGGRPRSNDQVRSGGAVWRPGAGVLSRMFGVAGLIAGREIRQRVRGKVFRGATLLILIGVAAAIVIPAVHKSKATALHLGVVGAISAPVQRAIDSTATGLGTTAHVVGEPSESAADSALRFAASTIRCRCRFWIEMWQMRKSGLPR